VVGYEDQHRAGVWVFAIRFNGSQLGIVRVRASPEKSFNAANKKYLKGRHERGRAGPVHNLGQVGFAQIKFKKTEIAQVGGNQMFENRFPAPLAEKHFVAHKHISRAQVSRLHVRDKTVCLGKRAHQKPSRMFDTRVCANSRDNRSKAGESSSKKLGGSLET